FGFGGINAHVLIEEWDPRSKTETQRDAAVPSLDPVPIAIVGMSAHFGPFRGLRGVHGRGLGGGAAGARRGARNWGGGGRRAGVPRNWWGVEEAARFPGYYLEALALRLDRFRIPPRELEEMLPQQSLALLAAAEAIADAGWDDRPRLRAGVCFGIGLDLNATN